MLSLCENAEKNVRKETDVCLIMRRVSDVRRVRGMDDYGARNCGGGAVKYDRNIGTFEDVIVFVSLCYDGDRRCYVFFYEKCDDKLFVCCRITIFDEKY